MNDFDCIVIGSGIGGLTTASLLSRLRKQRVLVLERHFKPGGFTHIFKRGKYKWDVGIHYIGGMAEGEMMRGMVDYLTDHRLKWARMNDPFEKFVYPDFTFSLRSGAQNYQEDLVAMFPDEKKAIEHYIKDVTSTAGWFGRHITMKSVPPLIEKIAAPLILHGGHSALMSTKEYLDKNFKDEKLKALLVSQWGDYGLPPAQSTFAIHSLIVTHYFDGGFYPVGSSSQIAESIIPSIEQNGGEIRLYHDVEEILIESGKVTGVRATEYQGVNAIERQYTAPVIISDAGGYNTYCRLISNANAEKSSEIKQARSFYEKNMRGSSNVTLYLGLKRSPAELGFAGENHWIYPGYDHDHNFKNRNDLLNGNPAAAYLSFPSLKDPSAQDHTAEIISFVDYEPFAKWKTAPWKNRGGEYDQIKESITEGLLNFVESHYLGFKDLIDYKELSTPVTNEFFTGHPDGMIYGLPCTKERFQSKWASVRTPVDHLFLTGADASSPGFAGAMMGGFAAASAVMGLGGLMKLMKELRAGK